MIQEEAPLDTNERRGLLFSGMLAIGMKREEGKCHVQNVISLTAYILEQYTEQVTI